jgi:hypothetical protein
MEMGAVTVRLQLQLLRIFARRFALSCGYFSIQ